MIDPMSHLRAKHAFLRLKVLDTLFRKQVQDTCV